MDINKQVATLEQSKKLKELGVEIESYFMWVLHMLKPIIDCTENADIYTCLISAPAPTAEEIAELLPDKIRIDNEIYWLETHKEDGEWDCIYTKTSGLKLKKIHSKSLTQALVSMLIWLIENNHVNPKELNGK